MLVKYIMISCAPGRDNDGICFSLDQLINMVEAHNNLKPNNKIILKNDKKYLLNALKQKYVDICGDDDYCLTKQDFINHISRNIKNDITKNTFRTIGPKGNNDWLTTSHINNILKQYEKVDKSFKFLGAVPLDCQKVSVCNLYKLNFNDYQSKSKNKIAIVFNLDKFGEPGSHWVALYMDMIKGEIDFCDSAGHEPLKDIVDLIDQFKKWYYKQYGKDPIYKYNKKRIQFDNSECGIYSVNYIIRRLKGESLNEIVKNPLNYSQINSCRNLYFYNKISNAIPDAKCDI